jgi:hypothetical protein
MGKKGERFVTEQSNITSTSHEVQIKLVTNLSKIYNFYFEHTVYIKTYEENNI